MNNFRHFFNVTFIVEGHSPNPYDLNADDIVEAIDTKIQVLDLEQEDIGDQAIFDAIEFFDVEEVE